MKAVFFTLPFFFLLTESLLADERGADSIASVVGMELTIAEKRTIIRDSAITWQGKPPSLHRFFEMEVPDGQVQSLIQALLDLGLDPNEENDKGESAAVAMLNSSLTAPVPELVQRIERGEMVAVKVSGSGHLYGVVFYKGNIYICNKRMAYIEEPGIYRAKIGDLGGLAELIMRFKEERPVKETLGLTKENRPIFTLLKAEEGAVHFRGKPQRVGNCAIASSEERSYPPCMI